MAFPLPSPSSDLKVPNKALTALNWLNEKIRYRLDGFIVLTDPPPRDFGYQVSVSMEQSERTSLPTIPLIMEPMRYNVLGWDSK